VNFGEGQMKNPHFAGSPDMESPVHVYLGFIHIRSLKLT